MELICDKCLIVRCSIWSQLKWEYVFTWWRSIEFHLCTIGIRIWGRALLRETTKYLLLLNTKTTITSTLNSILLTFFRNLYFITNYLAEFFWLLHFIPWWRKRCKRTRTSNIKNTKLWCRFNFYKRLRLASDSNTNQWRSDHKTSSSKHLNIECVICYSWCIVIQLVNCASLLSWSKFTAVVFYLYSFFFIKVTWIFGLR